MTIVVVAPKISPTAVAASTPVIPTTSAGVIAPTPEVKPKLGNPIVISPRESAPTLDAKPEGAVNVIVGDNIIVAETPVNPITSATFKIKSPPQVTPISPTSEEPPQP